jgi:DNA-binding IclR family transcriptional regulator
LEIIEFLALHSNGKSLSEIAQALEYPKNSVFRILNTLLAFGYVDRNEATMLFTLSRKFVTLSYGSAQGKNLLENALDLMRELRDDVEETVVISIVDRSEGITLEQIQGLHPFRFVCDPGNRQPLHASASPKAILAFLPGREQAALVDRMSFPRFNARTIGSREEYRKELERVRGCGYAVDRAEQLEGVHCIAAPVFDHRGYPVAAITVTGPADRLPASEFERLGARVCACALRISQRLGYGLLGATATASTMAPSRQDYVERFVGAATSHNERLHDKRN